MIFADSVQFAYDFCFISIFFGCYIILPASPTLTRTYTLADTCTIFLTSMPSARHYNLIFYLYLCSRPPYIPAVFILADRKHVKKKTRAFHALLTSMWIYAIKNLVL